MVISLVSLLKATTRTGGICKGGRPVTIAAALFACPSSLAKGMLESCSVIKDCFTMSFWPLKIALVLEELPSGTGKSMLSTVIVLCGGGKLHSGQLFSAETCLELTATSRNRGKDNK